jgi:thiamine pyrophosphate-dependent acetolactate synthase large subunit-like protein
MKPYQPRPDGTLDRRAVVKTLLADAGDLLVVTGLGSPTYDAGASGDRAETFYLWGAMGGASMIGLGIALAQPKRRVLVLTGDGEMLMSMGALATIAGVAPPNLSIAVLDNARFGETGSQRSHTGLSTDLAAVARACGWAETVTVTDEAGVAALAGALRERPIFAVMRIAPGEPPRFLPPRDGVYLAQRFRAALGLTPS